MATGLGDTLLEIARRYGTPTYAFDVGRMRSQVAKLRDHLPPDLDILYSLKANGSLGLCGVFASSGLGADVASLGELLTALEAGFPPERIFVAGPYKSPDTLTRLRSMPQAVLSIDSSSELERLAREAFPNRCVLRLRPDFESRALVRAGRESRFGIPLEELGAVRKHVGAMKLIGFHVFSGSQVLDVAAVIAHFRGAMDLCLRTADLAGIDPELINLGGGFGVPYGPNQEELDLAPIGEELHSLASRAPGARLAIELGRYLVAQAGWYLTTVVGHQTRPGRAAVVVDGGTHQRWDLCGLGLRHKTVPPFVLGGTRSPGSPAPTDVLGSLSLPDDILAESVPLPPLSPGQVLAFPNAGAYGLWASPALFHGHPLPAEVAFEGKDLQLMRERQAPRCILEGQRLLRSPP